MKCLAIDSECYRYPDGIYDLESFSKLLNDSFNSFIALKKLLDDICVAPYFIDGNEMTVYLNVSMISEVSETECTILSKEEYNRRLKKTVEEKCTHCSNYPCEEDDDLEDYRDKLSLDGKCIFFSKAETE